MNQQAEYFDGQTAARYSVALRFDAAGLQISEDGINQFWPYANIRYASEDPDDRPLTFRCHMSQLDATRLIIADQTTIDTLRIRCPDLEDRIRRNRQRKRGVLWATAGTVSLGLIVWSSIHFLPRIAAPLIPISWEESLGDAVVDDIEGIFGAVTKGEVKRCETADGRLALDILTSLLVSQVKTPYRFTIIVLDVDMVNALAAPGGRIVVFKKLLSEATSADEVAGILAHEMGHVISRDPTEAVARDMGMSLVFNVLLGGLGSGITGAAGQALLSSAYSRDAEQASDRIALGILSRAQISPKGFADFFDRMSKEDGGVGGAMSFMSSHPPSGERAKAARNAVPANVQPALSDADWKALKTICGNS
ncbi:MAG: M48 family metallopeptidase [Proteobacteria bacterium]|nr:M48 family metallopeptidase [Pseudomonadota bacterium]MDA1324805.1 M48 family metallopeptidase [Pseudomonadota bacterium]